jgi:hypothetical protein
MKLRKLSIVCCLSVVGVCAASASATIFNAPCPQGCNSLTPHIPLDDQEGEYTCCKGSACTVCDDCPWYLEYWC